jgi:hypothetical protein
MRYCEPAVSAKDYWEKLVWSDHLIPKRSLHIGHFFICSAHFPQARQRFSRGSSILFASQKQNPRFSSQMIF